MYTENEVKEILHYSKIDEKEFMDALPYEVETMPACFFEDQVHDAIDVVIMKRKK